jgi:hypothetical protein
MFSYDSLLWQGKAREGFSGQQSGAMDRQTNLGVLLE